MVSIAMRQRNWRIPYARPLPWQAPCEKPGSATRSAGVPAAASWTSRSPTVARAALRKGSFCSSGIRKLKGYHEPLVARGAR